ncbi:MAG: UDP-N-acetylglucosamine 2-epimerase (non-hydrolyzing) [Bacteroidetes bacterium]|nr:UDP-N-acetylglucosamine 2-epimerase (non-hydrolyzing) [Bacteroidota bacterium]
MTLRILTVVGARPQFVKAATLSRHIRDYRGDSVNEKIIHTGQHYDENMSDVFFKQLDIPTPTFQFEVSSATHGAMTGKMLREIESVILEDKPDCLLVYGDTNSTLAGALAAAKLHVPVAHVEAGLRSFNKRMPEEINRIVTDQVSTWLYCPTDTACTNLHNEGITNGIYNVGDIMYDAALYYLNRAENSSTILDFFGLEPKKYILSTIHRVENTNTVERIGEICKGLALLAESWPVVFPVHPRTRKIILHQGLDTHLGKVAMVDPIPFLDMVILQKYASAILTDSGGIQKEAYFYKTPCITVRDETEWVETLTTGWNKLVSPDAELIAQTVLSAKSPTRAQSPVFGTGNTAKQIIDNLLGNLKN